MNIIQWYKNTRNILNNCYNILSNKYYCNISSTNKTISNLSINIDNIDKNLFFNMWTANQTSYTGLFSHYRNNGKLYLSNLPVDYVTDMSDMFLFSENVERIIINSNTRNLIYTNHMFSGCTNLKSYVDGIDGLNFKFNTQKVTNMSAMFDYCSNLLNLPSFTTSNVKDMSSICAECHNLRKSIASTVNNIENMAFAYYNCYNMTDVNWIFSSNMSKIKNWAYSFANCKNLTTIKALPYNQGGNPQNMLNTFYGCVNLSDSSIGNIIENMLPNYSQIIGGNNNLTYIGLTSAQINNIPENIRAIGRNKGWNLPELVVINNSCFLNYSLPSTPTTYTLWSPSSSIISDTTGIWINGHLYNNRPYNLSIKGAGYITNWTNTLDYCCSSLRYLLSLDNTINATSMGSMFSMLYNLVNVCNFNTSKVTNMGMMFYCCNNLHNVPLFNTSNVTNMDWMFHGCNSLTSVPAFNTLKVTKFGQMFTTCSNLTSLPAFTSTANVTGSLYLFAYNCYNLRSVPNYNLHKVTNMSTSFAGCRNLTTIYQMNTKNCVDWSEAFRSCNNLTNASVINIIKMLLNSNNRGMNSWTMNLMTNNYYSVFHYTKFNNSYYTAYHSQLTAAGWTY